MFNSLNINPTAFGLDVSNSSIKIIQLKKSGKLFKLVSWGETQIEPGVIENGEIKNEDKFLGLLKQAIRNVKGKKIKTKNAVVSLLEKKTFLGIIQLPMMTKEELRSAITFQAENYIPLPINEVYFDFQVIPLDSKIKDRCDVLLIAFPKKIIDQYLTIFKKAGILPIALETESQAITRVLSKNNAEGSSFFVINFGKSNTIFAAFSDHSLHFSSSIPISSQDLTKAISQSLKVKLEEAEKLKLKYGLRASQGSKKEGEEVSKAIEPIFNDLCKQVKKYISYYRTYGYPEYSNADENNTKSKKIEKIILCGEGANLRGLHDFFSSRLEIPIKLANPWLNIFKKESVSLPLKEPLGYVVALGLALRITEKNYD
ncbi:type IV pilus assembly protein PilM [Patescibacteria group bacterium]|nr:type IV pilus assembly protein PilM [Patescibacteria group bacterium]MBU4274409.1 type IV pilus assembly protein PilM [Patescibacteria group bacterium]MBU4368011.1 type IV pilus assembly protein PilM [Patescibacteria group bacterium]MBU4462246.1 type IV pilus assembly protein PilM [Patescibacteria group bacterium]MCG2699602.1 type IV pilus assembly protein PilM [Candidatus Parcubacteria bacterium]